MSLRTLLIAGTCLAVLSSTASYGYAQQRYQPAYPTFSPVFNYLRRDTGVLNNYYGLVQPMRQIESTQNRLRDAARQQRTAINNLRAEISDVREAQVSPTGKGASFMNYSHYFRGLNGRSGRRR